MDRQLNLFDPPDGAPVQRAKTLRELDRESRPRWIRFSPRDRVPCDECVTYLHENGGVGPYPRGARWRRVTSVAELRLCPEHADAWKAEERR